MPCYISSQQKPEEVMFILHKVDYRVKNITIGKIESFIMIKGSTYEEKITPLNVYTTNSRNSKT